MTLRVEFRPGEPCQGLEFGKLQRLESFRTLDERNGGGGGVILNYSASHNYWKIISSD